MGVHRRAAAMALVAGLALASPALAAVSDAQLIARSQALLDAVGSGDKALWAKTLADDGVFTDEDGEVRTKAQVVAQIAPLPSGFVGALRVVAPKVVRSGDTAVLTYEAMETLTVHGQTLRTHYHTTDVYRTDRPEPRLIASQTSVLPAEAKPVGPPASLADFAGDYRLGPTDRMRLSVEGGALVSTRNGAREVLIALGGDWFARTGRPRVHRIFIRDGSGRVTGFTERRDNGDLMWSRE